MAVSTEKSERVQRILTYAKFGFLLLLILAVPAYLLIFQREFLSELRDINYVKSLLASYKKQAAIIYLISQVVQILISVIPGQALQIAAGFTFGVPIGLGLSIIGAMIGSTLTYYLGKWLGKDAIHMLFGEERMSRYVNHINSRRGVAVVFLLYLIPGLPKDIINYVAGISSMPFKMFLLVSMVGRIPGMVGSLFIGRQVFHGGYTSALIIFGVAVVLFLIGIWQRERLMTRFDSWYDKLSE